MEAAASVAVAARGVSMAMPPSRKEWRVVSDHPVQNSGNEDLDRSKLGQGDERLIYEVRQGREPMGVDFFPITVDGDSDHEPLLDEVVKQREQLQHLEVNLKARLIAGSELMKMQEQFDSQIKDHVTSNVKLQEQLHKREKTIQDLQRTIEDKDKEIHAIRLDHQAAWAKEDLLREQNKELASFRELDNSEVERAQHIKKIHDLQEHIQEKDRKFLEMQEQNRVAQETIIYKDEQTREAQAWITRAQEVDALQSTTNHSLQAELRQRTDQYNQLWLGCQRQFTEMERLHLQTLQQLQLELSEARERSGTNSNELKTTRTNLKDTSDFGHNNGSQLEVSGGNTPAGNSGDLQNGNVEVVSSFAPTGSASTQIDHTSTVQMAPQSLHGMPTCLPPGQPAALHPFVMHQQGVPENVNSHLIQSHGGQFFSVPANSSLPHWQYQHALFVGSEIPNHEQYPSQNDQHLSISETNYEYDVSAKGQASHSDPLDAHISQGTESPSVVQGQEKNATILSNHEGESQNVTTEQLGSASNASEAIRPVKSNETTQNKVDGATMLEGGVASRQKSSLYVEKTAETALLDEESLLACVVRTIPFGPGGRIRISSTLPNRLAKMLAPLHWSDYKKKYGKLDDFLGSHPELFMIEGDHIQVREGAQEIIAAMATRAKVRATAVAAAAVSSHSSISPSIAVTPMAQPQLKKAPSVNSISVKAEKSRFGESQILATQNQHSNGISYNNVKSISSVRILSKHSDHTKLNGSETRPGQDSSLVANGNGTNLDRADMGSSQTKAINHGRPSFNFSGKRQGRSAGAIPSSKR